MAARSFVLAPLRASRQCPRFFNGIAPPSIGNAAAVREGWSAFRMEFRGSSIFTLAGPSNSLRSKYGIFLIQVNRAWKGILV